MLAATIGASQQPSTAAKKPPVATKKKSSATAKKPTKPAVAPDASATPAATPAPPANAVSLIPAVVDLGTVRATEPPRKVQVTLSNTTKGTVRLTGIQSSCGCATALPAKSTLEPGESTPVEVTFFAHGYFGPVKRVITLRTDSPEVPVLTLAIQAQVDAAYLVQPSSATFLVAGPTPTEPAHMAPGSAEKVVLRFIPATKVYHIKNVVLDPPAPFLRTSWEDAPGGEIHVTVLADPNAVPWSTVPQGLVETQLRIVTQELGADTAHARILYQCARAPQQPAAAAPPPASGLQKPQ
jgi:hypothetical protein